MSTERVTLHGVAFGGEALGHLADGRVVFVPFALPGEKVEIELTEEKQDYARGRVVEVITRSEERVEPPCKYFGECGGCTWQHAAYPAQLRFKQQVVTDQLRRIGHFADAESLVRPAIGMVERWNYRNQTRFAVGRKWGELCFTQRGTHRMLGIDYCHIAQPRIDDALARLQRKLTGQKLHQVVIRSSENTQQTLISPRLPTVPDVETGQACLEEEILTRRYAVSADVFFQVNTRREWRGVPDAVSSIRSPLPANGLSMADILALLVLDRMRPHPDDTVLDLYCGVGAFSALLSPLVQRVIGVEESRRAVADARRNLADLHNVEILEGKAEHIIATAEWNPRAAVLDPARVGCDPAVLDALLRMRPERLVYVSCDPATLARDLRSLVDGGYELLEVQPLDMFPQTYHIENVATLRA